MKTLQMSELGAVANEEKILIPPDHIVFVLFVCLFCLSVCMLSTLTFAITFEL